jgi:hypothetical protein
MDKILRRTVTITIIETWTIIWADGAEHTAVYRRQLTQTLPNDPDEPQAGNDRKAIVTTPDQGAPSTQVSGPLSEVTDSTGSYVEQKVMWFFKKGAFT